MTKTVTHISFQELCEIENVSRRVVISLVEYDIAQPVSGSGAEDWVFDTHGAHWLKKAIRLRRDLELDWMAIAMLVDLLRQRERLADENRQLRQRLERFLEEN